MFSRPMFFGSRDNDRGLGLLTVFFLLFALWHVSQHDLPLAAGADNTAHCDICRLNHVPILGGATLALFAAVFIGVTPLARRSIPHPRSKSYLPHLARGPPSA